MTRLGRCSRVLSSACTCVLVAVSVTGGAFLATLALMPSALPGESAAAASPQVSVRKIGPGYGRMPAIDLGKPDKVAYSTPYHPHATIPRTVRANKRAAPTIIAESAANISPIKVAAAFQSFYSAPDIHRVY
jgi:hypothetical protein